MYDTMGWACNGTDLKKGGETLIFKLQIQINNNNMRICRMKT
jgi:hypothetical protein